MRIVIDMQGAQTESKFRGIGRYTTSLVNALIKNKEFPKSHSISKRSVAWIESDINEWVSSKIKSL